MHLKALEIQGFKSFPDKTLLSFDARITAIVGPNGSGKSNISDAVRWVMGEQSTRALRGGKMEDVIFGGTEARKSLGFAQVSLTLDNEDGSLPVDANEVVVTRRYYRSGESEYYINRTLVRLRDINELFMDTGLGQEGYSLIGQGKIDEILSVKSTQRREIFEEEAGISRFRHRKEEAERKLQRTQENLLRIHDKMEELEMQLAPLAEQAEKAEQYFKARDQLRLLEVSLWMDRLEKLRAQHREVREAHEAMERQLLEVKAQTEELYRQSEELGQLAQEKEGELETARRGLATLEEALSACEGRISVLMARLSGHEDTTRRLREEQVERLRRAESLQEQMCARKERLAALEEEMAAGRETLENLEGQRLLLLEAQEGENFRFRALRGRAEETERAARETESRLLALDAATQEVDEREDMLRQSLARVEAQQGTLQEEQAAIRAEFAELERTRGEREQARLLLKARVEDLAGEEQAADKALVALRMEENAQASRIRMLAEMEKLYEGYSKSVKTVMNEAGRGALRGVLGPVAGLIQVPGEYTVALEIALGGAMQHLVVETEEDGKGVLSYLKRRDAGRVTCLPLGAMRPGRLEESGLPGMEGYIGIAAELLTYDPRYEKVIWNLLGRVAIVRDLDCGIAMARRYHYRFRIVTLDGQVLSPGGSMTGGSVQQKAGILSRAHELEILREKEAKLKTDCQRAEAQLEYCRRAHTTVRGEWVALQEEIQGLAKAVLLAQSRLESRAAQLEEQKRQRDRLVEELETLSGRGVERREREASLREEIARLREGTTSLFGELAAAEASLDDLTERSRILGEDMQQRRMAMGQLEAEARVSREALDQLQTLYAALGEDNRRQGEEIARLEAESDAFLTERQAEETRRAELQAQRSEAQSTLDTLGREKLSLEARRNQSDRESRSRNDTLLYCQREVTVLEQRRRAGEEEEALLLGKLWETYELSHEGATALRLPVENVKEMERRIAALRGEIRGLGNVNLGAVEEYQRVKERYEYLRDQRRDVEEAGAQLVRIIAELTGEMKTIFRREFQRINQAFRETFLQLFQGGRASLRLEDEEDILNCGIEIEAQPPGKTLSNLSLLSGGEKAFVAIALYFAILKIRPTPFCVLDEIEAALDDVNVVRFARYLRGISDKTQFIVITHRRGTMEEADVLYGVTMERQGVSRLLHLNLNEAERALGLAEGSEGA